MKRSSLHAEGLSSTPTVSRSVVQTWFPFARLRSLFRRPARRASFLRQPAPPAVILACEECGFDYTVTRLEMPGGETAIVWTCTCGSRFMAPGGAPTSRLIRP